MMSWIKKLFGRDPAESQADKEKKAKKRKSKEHSRRVRQREKELNRSSSGGFFWGSVAVDLRDRTIRKEIARNK